MFCLGCILLDENTTWCLSLLCIERGLIPPKALALGLDSGEGLLQQQGHLTELPYLADWQDPSPRRWHQACRECSFPTCLLELHRVFMPQAPGLGRSELALVHAIFMDLSIVCVL